MFTIRREINKNRGALDFDKSFFVSIFPSLTSIVKFGMGFALTLNEQKITIAKYNFSWYKNDFTLFICGSLQKTEITHF